MIDDLKGEMASKVKQWLAEAGYPYIILENDSPVLNVDAKVSSYKINVHVSSVKDLNAVFITSELKLSTLEKKQLDTIKSNIRDEFLDSIKRVGTITAQKLKLMYGMGESGFSGIEFWKILEYKYFNKVGFLETISNMVKVLDLASLKFTKLREEMKKIN